MRLVCFKTKKLISGRKNSLPWNTDLKKPLGFLPPQNEAKIHIIPTSSLVQQCLHPSFRANVPNSKAPQISMFKMTIQSRGAMWGLPSCELTRLLDYDVWPMRNLLGQQGSWITTYVRTASSIGKFGSLRESLKRGMGNLSAITSMWFSRESVLYLKNVPNLKYK